LEAAVTGKTLATPGLFTPKPKVSAGNTPSVFKANALGVNPLPLTNKSIKNRNLVMMANTVVDLTNASVLPEQEQEEASKGE